MKNKTSLTNSSIYYLVYNILNLAFPLVTGIYVARVLLPNDIGAVSTAQNLASYFVILSFLGIPTYGLREISKVRNNEEERNKVYSELYTINFISTFICLLIYLGIILLVPTYRSSLSLYLIAGSSIAFNIFNISWLFEGMEEFRFISIRNLVFKALCFIALLIFVRNENDYLAYAGVTVFGTAGNYLVNMFYAHRLARFDFKDLNLKRHLKSILYLTMVNLAIEIYSLVDITMMSFMSTNESIAYYKYGHSIFKMLLTVVNTFTMVLVPRISFYYKEGKYDEFNRLLSKTLKIIIIFAIPMIVGIYFTSDFLVTGMYGNNYIDSAGILKLFSILFLVSPIGYLLGSRVLLVTGNENKMIYAVGAGAIVNVIGNSILIPLYAEYGATIASIIGEFVVAVVYVGLGKKYFKLSGIVNSSIKVIISSLLMAIYLYLINFLNINGWILVIIKILGGIIIYGVSMILLKEEVIKGYVKEFIDKFKNHLTKKESN